VNLLIGRMRLIAASSLAAEWLVPGSRSRRLFDSEGQTLVEYGLILVLIAVVSVAAVAVFGGQVSTMFGSVTDKL
jgi:Flp pilus assembly pilin Flp